MALTQEQVDYVANTIGQMIRLLGLEAKVAAEEKDGTVVISIETPDAGRLIGRKGRTLENIEYLLNRIVSQKYETFARIRLDVSGYQREGEEEPAKTEAAPPEEPRPERAREEIPEKRRPEKRRPDARPDKGRPKDEKNLENLARDVAKEVKRWGDPKTIGPFAPNEQEIIQNTLKDDPEVQAEIGEERGGGKATIVVTTADSGGMTE